MVDFNDIRKRPDVYRTAVVNKRADVDVDKLVEIGEKSRVLRTELEKARAEGNILAAEIKQAGGKPQPEQIVAGRQLKEKAKELEAELNPLELEFDHMLAKVPNLPSEDTPVGKDDSENVVLRKWGEPRDFEKEGFKPKEHWELGASLDVLDTERAVKVSGSRFVFLKRDLALLQFALIQFGLEKLTDEKFLAEIIAENKLAVKPGAFIPVVPPVIIQPEPFQRMARLEPREERYHLHQDDQYLIGSAEHTLGAMHMDETFEEKELPRRYVGYSTSFRREAGSYGKDTKGMFRLHQFDKLEMESFSVAEQSLAEQDFLVAIQEKLLQLLGLPYEVMICCTGDQGDPDARHLDINTWLPGQPNDDGKLGRYRETHSADLMTDYQARRLNTKVKRQDGTRELVHMNDATAFAVGRTLIAIMENYQQADGTIEIPEVLQPYLGGKKLIAGVS